MVVKLCLMASHGYPPGGVVLHQEQGMSRAIQDFQPLFPCHGAKHEIMRLGSLKLRPQECEEPWKPIRGSSESNQFVKIDSTVNRPLLRDVQDGQPGSMLFGSGIAEHCIRHEKILQFLMFAANEPDGGGVDLALLSEVMGLQALRIDSQQPPTPLIYLGEELYAQKPLLDFVGDLVDSSRITIHPDGRVLFNGTGTEVNDILSVVAEFYLPQNSTKWKKQSMLVPRYNRLNSSDVGVSLDGSSLKLQATTVAPVKSPRKVKVKSPKKIGRKLGRERDLYKKNYFHACENLLSIMVDKKKHGKTAILSLKKSGPELPELLTQFSAGIAGTGLAVLFSVVCKLACSRVPLLCTPKLVNTGLGFGLVWLSWSVNKLRDTIVYISKNAGKLGLKEEEMMNGVDKSVKEIYFRAATLMAVAVLRFA
ncbi:hypothetical protein PanWU01x14_115010 [Parasponia andersonii]|uniref:Uncharacterized protein n=1 Tax=Parasponia andersonii TaxID=3476 RepID=A0A2P5CXJ0_PARAD|nr:hypothetical protein PanWU01x14_115010 [Parasponia andersonii]